MADQLTRQQLEAVQHSGGPLIVLAGPGTGKTRTIIARVAHLIEQRGVEPESIVALTFTVKAAGQLRERLAGQVGALLADRVNVSTIHGFGHKLVRRFGDLLGLPPELELIDAAQSHRLLKDVIVTHGLFADSRAEGLRSLIANLEQVFAGIANRGLSHKQCTKFVHEWGVRLERAPRPPTAGALTELEYEAQQAEHAWFADAVLAMNFFAEARWKRGWVTFDDFLTLPLRLLREHQSALAICRGDYRAFVVDEFQDCNPAQIELLRLLSPPESRPDLCVVGDDDQAIYRFRGADEQAFRRFETIWPGPKVVPLTENYRSQPAIIAVGNAVIGRAQSRFRPDKTIVFPEKKVALPADQCGVECVRLEEEFQDAEVIAAMITGDRTATALAGQTRAWNRYAVIARGHGDLDRVAAALRLEGVPYERVKERSILDDAGVEDVLAWVEWLINPEASWAARRVLARPPYGVPAEAALSWELEYKGQASQWGAGREGVEEPGRFDEWLKVRAVEYPAVARAVELYQRLMTEVGSMRGDEAVFRVITATDAAHAELLPGRDRAERVAALVALIGLARDKQHRLEPPGDLAEFWRYLEELRSAAGAIPAVEGMSSVSETPATLDEDETAGGVQLLTAHSSKGLEFDTVFVPRVKAPYGFPCLRSDSGWEPPEGLFDSLDPRTEAERCADEERRLFYVACTRAERRLVLLSKPNKTVTKTVNYFDELTRTPGTPVSVHEARHILEEAAARGGVPASAIEVAGLDFKGRAAARQAGERARREARLAAARALELVDRGDVTPEQVTKAAEMLKGAAEQIALTAATQAAGQAPAWLLKQRPDLRPMGERLARLMKEENAADVSPESLLVKAMPAPLHLSYTTIYEYHNCARCWYLGRVLRLPQPYSDDANLGTVAHAALKTFYDRWAKADAEGLPRPGAEQLVTLARETFIATLGSRQVVDNEALEQLSAQMRLLMANLHHDGAQVLETERSIDFDYEVDGVAHRFTAKLDRIDLLPDGGVRVIDYKTGYASQRYLAPKKDDLQMGIYALALKLAKGLGWADGGDVRGVAEYWCLSTGERGTISFAELDEAKVRAQIDKAARGMLKGEFPCGDGCGGPCTLFGS
ncbi:MAG TPA: ATP-dependent DNA helicase [Phycisphaerales bacterium]|nr:ATP-dependent DNA helicase [Phycisphaerales bacterium]